MRVLLPVLALALAACASGPDPLSLDEATFGRELEQRFQYGPPQPAPAEVEDERAGQIADAAYFAQFPNYDRSYSASARAEALRLAAALQAEAGALSHEQFVLRTAEIAALADNGHTAIGRNAFMKNTPRIPLRTYLFADGLHVLYANAANADLLGARIDRIDTAAPSTTFTTSSAAIAAAPKPSAAASSSRCSNRRRCCGPPAWRQAPTP